MSDTYGYARVSTLKQKIERQIANIKKEYPNAIIIDEAYTGTSMDRPKWNKLVKALKPGDTVVFDEVSRMARDAQEGFEAYLDLYNRGINLVFLKERHIDTEVYRQTLNNHIALTGTDVDCILQGVNEYLMILAKKQIEIAFKTAEHEVSYLRKRTSEGVQRAKERYRQEEIEGKPHTKKNVGRPQGSEIVTKKAKAMKEKILKMSKDFSGNMTDKEIIETLEIARNTYYKYKRQLKENM